MSYERYVVAAYSVFAIVLGWDFLATQMRIARQLRIARQRHARGAARSKPKQTVELQ